MRIALNLLYLLPNIVGGTQTYAVSLLQALAALDSENEYFLYLNRESAELELAAAPNVHRVICPVRAMRREERYLYEQTVFPGVLRQHKIALLHSLGYVGPVFSPCPQVVTIHDVNFLAIPATMSSARQAALNRLVPLVARRSARVIAVSEFTKTQITQYLGVRPERICVTHEGPRAAVPSPKGSWDDLAALYGIGGPYLLAFDSRSGHKNIERLLEAFASIQTQVPQTLLLVGHRPPGTEPDAVLMTLGTRVKVTGYVPEAHIMPLLAHADLFVFPSLYEGFGLPVLEAQAAGVAVACSTAASLPEVAGDGAAYFAPESAEEIAKIMADCLGDPIRRAALIARGRANVARFSWERTAAATLDCYRAAVHA